MSKTSQVNMMQINDLVDKDKHGWVNKKVGLNFNLTLNEIIRFSY